jgi:hypothetical protein
MTDSILKKIDTIEKFLLAATVLLPFSLVVVFMLGRWPEYWKWIASEDTPMTSLEVTVMYTTALVCWVGAAQSYFHHDESRSKKWVALGFGFLWLAMDDRFAIHERIRDHILIPHHISIPLLPIGPGDFILLIYMVVGLALLPWFFAIFKAHKKALVRFLCGVAVAVFAVMLDAYDWHQASLDVQRFEQTIEEIFELIAQVLFLQGCVMVVINELRGQQIKQAAKI